jgi:hypothetical protein
MRNPTGAGYRIVRHFFDFDDDPDFDGGATITKPAEIRINLRRPCPTVADKYETSDGQSRQK